MPRAPVPALMNGDRLAREEFERRYLAMPPGTRAELVEGIVYMPSPVRVEHHGTPHARLGWWVVSYQMFTPGVIAADNATVRLDVDNEPQPDIFLCIPTAAGGQSKVSADDYLEGAPEFVAEVAASGVSIDLHAKLNAYRRNGVREYVVWRVEDGAIDWMVLRAGQFVPLAPGPDGIFRSEAFPGLWLDATAMILADTPRLLKVLQEGAATPEHASFAARMATAAQVATK